MTIWSKPFLNISSSDIHNLVSGGSREGTLLDFKEELELLSPPKPNVKHDFLKDVTAMANASGGTIVYGVEDDDGQAVEVKPFPVTKIDEVRSRIDNIVDSCIQERILGILHREIDMGSNKFCWVLRVPPSHLAPHMIDMPKIARPLFYRRENTTNLPLDVRGIKELALKAGTAQGRALSLVSERTDAMVRRAGKNFPDSDNEPSNFAVRAFALLFVVPLFPQPFDEDFIEANAPVSGSSRYALEGLYHEQPGGYVAPERHVLYLRKGGGRVPDT